jgi:flavin-dependent dehydrogenase
MPHEVIIVGGGPAACAAALSLSAIGLSVCVIASANLKKRPTETVVPALPQLLRSLDARVALAACEPCFGIVSAWGRQSPAFRPAIANPYGHAWFVHRDRFDAALQEIARKRGVDWINGEAQNMVDGNDGALVSTATRRMHARWIIVATGSPASAARLTGQKVIRLDSMVAFWAKLSVPFENRLLFVEPAEQGWWYLGPADGPGAIACFMTDAASARTLAPSRPTAWNVLFQATRLFQQLHGEPYAEQVFVALSGLAALPEKHGTHWIAVGDAAASLDPLGSSGTATALDSGRRAAHAIADFLKGNNGALDRYSLWGTRLVKEFAMQRRQQYEGEARMRGHVFWRERLKSTARNHVASTYSDQQSGNPDG